MILTGIEIRNQQQDNRITIIPFNDTHINPNSYDVCIGNQLLIYRDSVLDPARLNSFDTVIIPEHGYILKGGNFYLASTVEKIGSDHYVPILHAKSGTARMGLFVHVTADLIDIGSHGNLTLQLAPVVDILIYPFTRIAQVSFWKPAGEIHLYNGKYKGSVGPQPSKSYMDFGHTHGK